MKTLGSDKIYFLEEVKLMAKFDPVLKGHHQNELSMSPRGRIFHNMTDIRIERLSYYLKWNARSQKQLDYDAEVKQK